MGISGLCRGFGVLGTAPTLQQSKSEVILTVPYKYIKNIQLLQTAGSSQARMVLLLKAWEIEHAAEPVLAESMSAGSIGAYIITNIILRSI